MEVLAGARLRAEERAVVVTPAALSVPIALVRWEGQSLFRIPGEAPVCQILPAAELVALMPVLERAGCAPSPEGGSS